MDVFSKAGFSFGLLAFIFARITLTRTGRLEEKLKAFSILEQAFKSE